jgi:hypothetical protein
VEPTNTENTLAYYGNFQLRPKDCEGLWPVLAALGQAEALLVNIQQWWTCEALKNTLSYIRHETQNNDIQHNDTLTLSIKHRHLRVIRLNTGPYYLPKLQEIVVPVATAK